MTTGPRAVETPVRVVDNGVRSFVPPTFCFELWDAAGNHVATVSRVVMSDPDDRELADFDAVATLGETRFLGRIDPYDAGPDARGQGARFTVTARVT
ncbi:hypothetical protein [Streptomyces sp. NPDC048172]|uniref:hypothetical protein n=1 Tax=Streptomyces sp. NPDC048172 TaxID=3365505 RepID=UPI003717035B